HLFMNSLYEAIVLVVVVSLIGFWEWRSALLMACSVPITLAMTFRLMHLCGIDLQQGSTAPLLIAPRPPLDAPLGAGAATQRCARGGAGGGTRAPLGGGPPPLIAAWLGPTKLATAIMFATVTNIVAYLPFLLLTGDNGKFMFSLPVVIGCSLLASRLVSMSFIP